MNTTVSADSHIAIFTDASRGIGCAIVMNIVADQSRAGLLRRVGSGDLVAPRDNVHVRAEVSDAA